MYKRFIISFFAISVLCPILGAAISHAGKVHIVRVNKSQVITDSARPNEFIVYLTSENGTGGVIITPAESPKFGNIKMIYAKERKELPDIGHPGGKKSGIELRVVFEEEIIGLPPDAWATFNIYQSGATEICTYSMDSIFCE